MSKGKGGFLRISLTDVLQNGILSLPLSLTMTEIVFEEDVSELVGCGRYQL